MKKALLPILAAFMVLALFAPAAAAGDYPQNGQFIAYYDSDAITKENAVSSANGGTTFFNAGAATKTASNLVATASLTANDWPQFHYDEKNAGHSPSTGLPSTNATKFDKDINAIGAVNPVVANGKIFVLTGYSGFDEPSGLTEIYLTCLDEATGNYVWNFTLPRNVHYGSWSSPATDGTYVYASSDNKTYCVRVSDGQEVWNFTTVGATSCNGGPTIGGDYVFCSDWSSPAAYYCLNRYNGTLMWTFDNSDTTTYDMNYAQGTPAYDSSDGAVYLTGWGYSGGQTGQLYKVNVTTGDEEWSAQVTGSSFCGSAAIDDEYVYVASYNFGGNGALYKYNKIDGWLEDSVTIETTDATPAIDEENGLIYISGGCYGYASPGVRCYDINDFSNLVWSRINENMGGWTCSVSLADGYAFVGRETGYPSYCYNTTYALNATTGVTEWFYSEGGATAAIANGDVYTIGNNGHLYAFG